MLSDIVSAEGIINEEKIRVLSIINNIAEGFGSNIFVEGFINSVRANQIAIKSMEYLSEDLKEFDLTYSTSQTNELSIFKNDKEILCFPLIHPLHNFEASEYELSLSISNLTKSGNNFSVENYTIKIADKIFKCFYFENKGKS